MTLDEYRQRVDGQRVAARRPTTQPVSLDQWQQYMQGPTFQGALSNLPPVPPEMDAAFRTAGPGYEHAKFSWQIQEAARRAGTPLPSLPENHGYRASYAPDGSVSEYGVVPNEGIPWWKVAAMYGGGALAAYALPALMSGGGAAAASSSAAQAAPAAGTLASSVPVAGSAAMTAAPAALASQAVPAGAMAGSGVGAGAGAAGASGGLWGSLGGTKGAIGIGTSLYPMFAGAGSKPGDDPYVQRAQQMQTQRMEQAQPIYDTLIRMAYNMSPIASRGAAPDFGGRR